MPRTSLKIVTAALIACAPPAFAQDDVAIDTVVATVNGAEITLGHMLMLRTTLPEQYQQLPANVLFDGILNQMIQQEALSQSENAEETDVVRLSLENQRRALLSSQVMSDFVPGEFSEADIQAAYEAQYGNETGTEYNASHILVETEEEAAALVTELEGGADFAELAREKSAGPSGPNGGSLGWFEAGQMVAPFQAAVETLEAGEFSAPVETQFGWHVVKLNETRLKEAPALDTVRDEIVNALSEEAVANGIDAAVAEADVTRPGDALDPNVLNRLDLLGTR
ncbi:peptidyl-prolyl cis-trans isomerase C [Roseivivax lentus]|uniref:Parvulin-like PPIase n=1 Tax=Roseivivax lentus TaxID=633194 RepID=A0A1N7K7K9_9RHOB|nr:peptidylprolyl isomerase [Roseivivax lentus]SIS57565.1 peptidyl-prolyl cis-trans isomerase C [Roseivivax lentus]